MTNETTQTSGPAGADGSAQSALRVVRGEASPEELAALVAVLAARSAAGADTGAGAADAPRRASGWTDRARYVRAGRLEFGATAGWRGSALPR